MGPEVGQRPPPIWSHHPHSQSLSHQQAAYTCIQHLKAKHWNFKLPKAKMRTMYIHLLISSLLYLLFFSYHLCWERERDVKIFYSIYLPLNCQQTAGCHYGRPDPDWHCWRLKGEGWWWGVPLPTPTTSHLCWMCCKKRAHVPNVRGSIAGAVL